MGDSSTNYLMRSYGGGPFNHHSSSEGGVISKPLPKMHEISMAQMVTTRKTLVE